MHVRDLGTGLDTSQPGGRAVLPWRRGDSMITFGLEGGASVTLRASGTEPKLKYYAEVSGLAGQRTACPARCCVGAVAEARLPHPWPATLVARASVWPQMRAVRAQVVSKEDAAAAAARAELLVAGVARDLVRPAESGLRPAAS